MNLFMKKHILLFLLSFFCLSTYSQVKDTIVSDDEIATITLKEVYLYSSPEKKMDEEARKKFLLLQYRVRKVYPYARIASDKLKEIEKTLDTIEKSRLKKKYIRKMQEEIEGEFSQQIKKLSRSQGRILIKLIHRQTGSSAFDLVKDLRSGWKAFWYNNTAWFYKLSLKTTYDPYQDREDFLIETILNKDFSTGLLVEQPSAFPIDYEHLKQKWSSSK